MLAFSLVLVPNNAFAIHSSSGVTWQLVVISSYPACSGNHYYIAQKYNDISEKYFELYQLKNSNYDVECLTESEYLEEYEAPDNLDLLILVYDRNKGRADLHSNNMGGLYTHEGNEWTHNHTIIICDCSNFTYSDPVWILSHELSHFILNYLGYDLNVVEDEIHKLDTKYDFCVEEEYDETCLPVKTRLDGYHSSWTVMTPYEPAIGKTPSFNGTSQGIEYSSPETMLKEITNWWIDGKIEDENYLKSLEIFSGKINEDGNRVLLNENSKIILTEPPKEEKNILSEIVKPYKRPQNIFAMTPFSEDGETFSTSKHTEQFPSWFITRAKWWVSEEIQDEEFLDGVNNLLNTSFESSNQKLQPQNRISDEGEKIDKIIDNIKANSYYDGILLQSLKDGKISVEALIGKGIALNNFGRYEEAIVYFDNALEIEPDNLNARKNKALSLFLMESYENHQIFELA